MIKSVFSANLFAGKVAVVTGGGSGIGLRTARELAQLGATVVIGGRNEEKLKSSVETIRAEGGTVHAFPLNIREPEQVKSFFEQVVATCGTLDFLVNNAGGQFPSPA